MKPPFRIGITDYVAAPGEVELSAFDGHAEICFLAIDEGNEPDPDVLASLDGLLVWHTPIGSELLSKLKRCRIIVRYGVGFDNVDLEAIEASGVPFCNTPDYGTEEVADTACSMILSLVRRVSLYDEAFRSGGTYEHDRVFQPTGRLRELSLGVIGVGRIGASVMQRMRPFGWRLFGFDPYLPAGHEKSLAYERVESLEELLASVDVVTVHCPLTSETRGMFDRSRFGQMRENSVFVNTARGPVLKDLDSIFWALIEGPLFGAGLDVLPEEPPDRDHPLISAWRGRQPELQGRLLLNEHTAFYSESAWREMRFKAAKTILCCLQDGVLRNRVA